MSCPRLATCSLAQAIPFPGCRSYNPLLQSLCPVRLSYRAMDFFHPFPTPVLTPSADMVTRAGSEALILIGIMSQTEGFMKLFEMLNLQGWGKPAQSVQLDLRVVEAEEERHAQEIVAPDSVGFEPSNQARGSARLD